MPKTNSRSRRIREAKTNKHYEEATISKIVNSEAQGKKSDELFTLDVSGSDSTMDKIDTNMRGKRKRRAVAEAPVQDLTPSELRKTKVVKKAGDVSVDRLVSAHNSDAQALESLVRSGKSKILQGQMKRGRFGSGGVGQVDFTSKSINCDLWEDNSTALLHEKSNELIYNKSDPTLRSRGGVVPISHNHRRSVLLNGGSMNLPGTGRKSGIVGSKPSVKGHVKKVTKVDLPLQGQSYNPEAYSHQEALGMALAFERRREEVREFNREGLVTERSELLDSVLIGGSESDESSDSEDDEMEVDVKVSKKRDKYTRAERNKQAKHKQKLSEIARAKANKKLLNDITHSKATGKQLMKKVRADLVKKEARDKVIAEERAKPLGTSLEAREFERNPLKASMLPVALTSELPSSKPTGTLGGLRTVISKGSLLSDRLNSMKSRGAVGEKSLREFRKVEGKKRKKMNTNKADGAVLRN